MLGALEFEQGDSIAAWQGWRDALSLAPDHFDAIVSIALQHLSASEIVELVLPPDPKLYYRLAMVYEQQNEREIAKSLASQAISLCKSDSTEELQLSSKCFELTGDLESAVAKLQLALRGAPEFLDRIAFEGLPFANCTTAKSARPKRTGKTGDLRTRR